MKTVFLIDDNEDYRETLRWILEDQGFEVVDTDCPDSAFEMLHKVGTPDLILCDLHMPFTTRDGSEEFKTSFEVGVKTVHELSWVYPDTPVLAMTALEEVDITRIKKYLAPIPAFQKPSKLSDMIHLVHGYLESKEMGGVQ
jgi:CheY-like chemotaxis protein